MSSLVRTPSIEWILVMTLMSGLCVSRREVAGVWEWSRENVRMNVITTSTSRTKFALSIRWWAKRRSLYNNSQYRIDHFAISANLINRSRNISFRSIPTVFCRNKAICMFDIHASAKKRHTMLHTVKDSDKVDTSVI